MIINFWERHITVHELPKTSVLQWRGLFIGTLHDDIEKGAGYKWKPAGIDLLYHPTDVRSEH